MTDNGNNKALILMEQVRGIRLHDMNERQRVEMGKELQAVLPVNLKSPLNALRFAMYCSSIGANPMREMHAWEDRDGKLVIAEDYKLLLRWANQIDRFVYWYEEEDPTKYGYNADEIVVRCFILRDDRLSTLERLAGIMGEEIALDRVTVSAVGVVTYDDMYSSRFEQVDGNWKIKDKRRWKRLDPPKTWTWTQRAEVRALKNAMRLSHGEPTHGELADLSWEVDGTRTISSDWSDVTPGMHQEEAEMHAKLAAEAREAGERIAQMSPEERRQVIEHGNEVLHGSDEDWDAPPIRKERAKQESAVTDVEPEEENDPPDHPGDEAYAEAHLSKLRELFAHGVEFEDEEKPSGPYQRAYQELVIISGEKPELPANIGQVKELLEKYE